ncbi:MAG: hypothetical protein GY708_18410 [Actinomycetia bacterium]|nr:hypothetical protein [Actinomycetes bacterium]MCP4963239.1 hypothetical protein [Actinomycetes bacterium]
MSVSDGFVDLTFDDGSKTKVVSVVITPVAAGGGTTTTTASQATTTTTQATTTTSTSTSTTTVATIPLGQTGMSFGVQDVASAGDGEQTGLIVADLDGDGRDDIIVTARPKSGTTHPAIIATRRDSDGSYESHTIDGSSLRIEAGATSGDVDGDGDIDIIAGGDFQESAIWWWENPGHTLAFHQTWTRRTALDPGSNQHHDMVFSDIDGDGTSELVFWTQAQGSVNDLMVASVPPIATDTWPHSVIYDGPAGDIREGIFLADVTGNGNVDIVAADVLLTRSGVLWSADAVGDDPSVQVAAGDLITGGRLEIVHSTGDHTGELAYYSWQGGSWSKTILEPNWRNGHTIDVFDIDDDGHMDIHSAEMFLGGGTTSHHRVYLGDGSGRFEAADLTTGFDNHDSSVGDVDGDGDLDIIAKPFRTGVGVRVMLRSGGLAQLGPWNVTNIATGVAKDVFVRYGDLDGDGDLDLVAGGAWYKNPGSLNGDWTKHTIGAGFGNIGAVVDLDRDGDLDLFGTAGTGAQNNGNLRWARNDGSGGFTVFTNLPSSSGDFLQGVEVFDEGGQIELILSWHKPNGAGTERLVASNPSAGSWTLSQLSAISGDEDVEFGDLDGDDDLDLVLGDRWLERTAGGYTARTAFVLDGPAGDNGTQTPDRVEVADLDNDGAQDIVVVYELLGDTSNPNRIWRVDWYRNSGDATFTQRTLGFMNGGHSLDVGDIDGDGDLDIVVGEHALSNAADGRVWAFRNPGDLDGAWPRWELDRGMEHHDGTQLADLDNDGDLDLVSIGWTDGRLRVWTNPIGSSTVSAYDDGVDITVVTRELTAVFQRTNGGLSHLYDSQGNDWIDWSPASRGAGEFRGVPNASYPDTILHPGSIGDGDLRIVAEAPNTVVLRFDSDDGNWSATWTIRETRIEFEMSAAPRPFWFLVEGPPAGTIDTDDKVITSGGTTALAATNIAGDITSEWVGLDGGPGPTLLIVGGADDSLADRVYEFESSMAVVGFGRGPDLTPLLTAPYTAVLGFVETTDPATLTSEAASWR